MINDRSRCAINNHGDGAVDSFLQDAQTRGPLKMIENGATLPTSHKSIEQLQDEFHRLNEQAMEIQSQLARVARQISGRDEKSNVTTPDPATTDTVEF